MSHMLHCRSRRSGATAAALSRAACPPPTPLPSACPRRLRAGLPIQERGHRVGRGSHCRRLPRVFWLLRVGWCARGLTQGGGRTTGWRVIAGRRSMSLAPRACASACLRPLVLVGVMRPTPSPQASRSLPLPPPPPPPPFPPCSRCYEVRCDPRGTLVDGYGNTMDRSSVCKAGEASVVVRTVDACEWCAAAQGAGQRHMRVQQQRQRLGCTDPWRAVSHCTPTPLSPCRPLPVPRQRLQ